MMNSASVMTVSDVVVAFNDDVGTILDTGGPGVVWGERVVVYGNAATELSYGRLTLVDSLLVHGVDDIDDMSRLAASAIWSSTLVGIHLPYVPSMGNDVIWLPASVVGNDSPPAGAPGLCMQAAPRFSPAGLLTSDPFVRVDEDGDGIPSFYLDPSSPCVDIGVSPSAVVPTRDPRTATTRADGALDVGPIDAGAHFPLPGLP